AGPGAADEDAVGTLAQRVGHLELGEDAFLAQVLQREVLLAAELAAQLDLPVLQRHVRRLDQARQFRLAPGPRHLLLRRGRPWPRGAAEVAAGAVVPGRLLLTPLHEVGLPWTFAGETGRPAVAILPGETINGTGKPRRPGEKETSVPLAPPLDG